MGFRRKLLAAFLGVSGGVLALCLLVVQRSETRRAEEEVRTGLALTRGAFEDLLRQRDRQLSSALRLLSGDFAFKQAVATGDPGTVRSAAGNHRARIGADVLLVADAEGRLLADTRAAARGAEAPAFLREALGGRTVSGVRVLDGVPYQLVALPLKAPDEIGAVAAGFLLDDALAAELKKATLSEVAFLAGDRAAGTTLPPDRRGALPPLGAEPALVRLGGERYLAVAAQTSGSVRAVLLRSWDRAAEPMRRMRRRMLLVGLAGLAAAALLGSLIAAGLTASLDRLVAAVGQVAAGRYDVRVGIESKDEVGRLARAFDDMARGLLERERIRSILNKTVSKEIAEALVSRGQVELGGEEREVTILFSDIRSFTTVSETLRPRDLLAQLNEYFAGMAKAVEEHRGVVDKYVGDAVMALFGAPVRSGDDAANALRAALAMLRALEELNVRRAARGLAPWRIGIGVNTGTVVAGTLGSEERWSYTVIGDAVNLASRLESETKRLGAAVVVSARTKELAGPGFRWRALEQVVVKGKTEAVETFELLGEA